MQILDSLLGRRIGKARAVPVVTKILVVFLAIIVISNLASNYINLMFNRTELIRQMKAFLTKELHDLSSFVTNQAEIRKYTGNETESVESIRKKALHEMKNSKAVMLAVRQDGKLAFHAARFGSFTEFPDKEGFDTLIREYKSGNSEGFLAFKIGNAEYYSVFRYNPAWDLILIRGEEVNEFFAPQRAIFTRVTLIILIITLASAVIGIFLLREILKYVGVITKAIMKMAESQNLETIDLSRAPNDDITFLGAAFNSLSSTVNNLISIFRKFANQDIVIKAYRDREVKLEGVQRELTILFSDIKSFTFITEALGTDIIKLLNLHYDRAIREIIQHNGVIGAIIGDALLAVFGALDDVEKSHRNKSFEAVISAYRLQETAASLRSEMEAKKEEIIRASGKLSKEEEKVYKAVLLEIGVGIDGGEVFYGTLGSHLRMTNTVIGDNVNAASRLEGLTRVYKLPVIVSEYVKTDIERNEPGHGIHFIEVDTVQVKGKTKGVRIYWPVLKEHYSARVRAETHKFQAGLQLYYEGNWKAAHTVFNSSKLSLAGVFAERTASRKAPANWSGIWEMKTK